MVEIGRAMIANPDFIMKIRKNDSLVAYDANMLNTLY